MKRRFNAMSFVVGLCGVVGIVVTVAIILFGIDFVVFLLTK